MKEYFKQQSRIILILAFSISVLMNIGLTMAFFSQEAKFVENTNKLASKIDFLYSKLEDANKTLSVYNVDKAYLKKIHATDKQIDAILKATKVHKDVDPKY